MKHKENENLNIPSINIQSYIEIYRSIKDYTFLN